MYTLSHHYGCLVSPVAASITATSSDGMGSQIPGHRPRRESSGRIRSSYDAVNMSSTVSNSSWVSNGLNSTSRASFAINASPYNRTSHRYVDHWRRTPVKAPQTLLYGKSVSAWHVDIRDDHIRAMPRRLPQSFAATLSSDHLEVVCPKPDGKPLRNDSSSSAIRIRFFSMPVPLSHH